MQEQTICRVTGIYKIAPLSSYMHMLQGYLEPWTSTRDGDDLGQLSPGQWRNLRGMRRVFVLVQEFFCDLHIHMILGTSHIKKIGNPSQYLLLHQLP